MIFNLLDPIALTGLLAGQQLAVLDIRLPSRQYFEVMRSLRLLSGGFSDNSTARIAARLSGRGEAIVKRCSTRDLDQLSTALDQLYVAVRRRLDTSNAIAASAREAAL